MDPARPLADGFLVEEGRIVALGTDADADVRTAAAVLDFEERTITPGFIDAHTHVLHAARQAERLSLEGVTTLETALERVRAAHARLPDGAWLVGFGQLGLSFARPPHRRDLDGAAASRAILLHNRDHHSAWVSSTALERAGVTRATADPEGGRIGRDPDGSPNGLLFENAVALVVRAIPRPGLDEDVAALARTLEAAAECGVTCVHDFEGLEAWNACDRLRGEGRLPVRVRLGVPAPDAASREIAPELPARRREDEQLSLFAVKCFLDGALGSRTAYLLEPYVGSDDRGLATLSRERLDALSQFAIEHDLSIAAHAIGDAAVRLALDAFESWPAAARARLRPRVEHAQLVSERDFARFGALGVVASMQPSHCVTDRPLARALWGGRDARGGYAWRQLLEEGAPLAFGSDAPIEPLDPRFGLWAAVTGGDP
ncbi:MAG: amidohydrolase, partial [Candidatus Eiseniibacteriota bacterium]